VLSYVWPDMTERVGRLRGAIAIARRLPATLHRRSAAEAINEFQLSTGALTVLWHSITWQYLSDNDRGAVSDGIDALAARATRRSPSAHLCLEPQRRSADAPHEFVLRSRSWPGGSDAILAGCAPHGPPVNWE
jgi:hypothetical protein